MKKIDLTATIWEEKGAYVSRCPELEVASYGEMPDRGPPKRAKNCPEVR